MYKNRDEGKVSFKDTVPHFFPKYNKIYWGMNHDYDHDLFQVHAVSGCCFMISAKCAQEVTPLDEGTFYMRKNLFWG